MPAWGIVIAYFFLFLVSIFDGARTFEIMVLLISIPFWVRAVDINVIPWGVFFSRRLKPGSTIKLVNWNTELWIDRLPEKRDEVFRFLKEQNADIYHLQEAHSRNLYAFPARRHLQTYFPDYEVIQCGELVTITRLPIKHVVAKLGNPFLRVDVATLQGEISFYNVHVAVHLITAQFLKSQRLFWGDMRRRFRLRKMQFDCLEKDLSSNTLPSVTSGDFNTPVTLRSIRRFRTQLVDAYAATHCGFPVTYRFLNWLRWWRIDYILGKKICFLKYSSSVPFLRSSDHDMLVCEFVVNNERS